MANGKTILMPHGATKIGDIMRCYTGFARGCCSLSEKDAKLAQKLG
jgi:hypothetical protein